MAAVCPGEGGRLLVNCVPMREQRTAKLTLNNVFDILKLIPLFTVSSQKATLSNVVIKRHTLLLLQPFPKFVKKRTLFLQNSIFPTLNDDSAGHCPARKKVPFLIVFLFTHRYTTEQQAPLPPPPGVCPKDQKKLSLIMKKLVYRGF